MKTISQRSEFVTSDYRHKLIQALDFRNRFAERPFLCNELILPDQIVVSREHACVFFKLCYENTLRRNSIYRGWMLKKNYPPDRP